METFHEKLFIFHLTRGMASCLWWCWVFGWRWATNSGSTAKDSSQRSSYLHPHLIIDKEEFNRVDDMDVVKDVWNTLWMAHEGSRPVRKVKVKMLEGQLNHFIMYNNKMPHEMFNRLKKLVNKARAPGSKN
jgi:hypothetical protein